MAYERIVAPKAELYHYTKKENLPKILADDRIRKFKDKECWFCASLEDTLQLMELTVMQEGGLYIVPTASQSVIRNLCRRIMSF